MMLDPHQKVSSSESDPDRLPIADPYSRVQTLNAWLRRLLIQPWEDILAKQDGNASWGRVCVLLVFLLLMKLTSILLANQLSVSPLYGLPFLRSSLSDLVGGLCTFFIVMGLIYLLARLFRGRGTFLVQCDSLLLPLIFISLFSNVLSYIGALIVPASSLRIMLLVFPGGKLLMRTVIDVHGLSLGKAATILLLVALAILLLSILLGSNFFSL